MDSTVRRLDLDEVVTKAGNIPSKVSDRILSSAQAVEKLEELKDQVLEYREMAPRVDALKVNNTLEEISRFLDSVER